MLQISGQADTTASKAAFLTGLAVVLTPFVAVIRTRRLPTAENAVGITLASIGFFLLTFPSGGGPMSRGDPLVLCCGVVFAFYGVELAERGGRHDAVWLTLIQLAYVAAAGGLFAMAARIPALADLRAVTLEARPVPLDECLPGERRVLRLGGNRRGVSRLDMGAGPNVGRPRRDHPGARARLRGPLRGGIPPRAPRASRHRRRRAGAGGNRGFGAASLASRISSSGSRKFSTAARAASACGLV